MTSFMVVLINVVPTCISSVRHIVLLLFLMKLLC